MSQVKLPRGKPQGVNVKDLDKLFELFAFHDTSSNNTFEWREIGPCVFKPVAQDFQSIFIK